VGECFLLVPAYPGSHGQKAVKRLCVCVFNSVPVITFQYLLRLPEKGDTKLGAVCLNCQPIFEIFSLSRFFSKFTAK